MDFEIIPVCWWWHVWDCGGTDRKKSLHLNLEQEDQHHVQVFLSLQALLSLSRLSHWLPCCISTLLLSNCYHGCSPRWHRFVGSHVLHKKNIDRVFCRV
jgi:hypothetical protein